MPIDTVILKQIEKLYFISRDQLDLTSSENLLQALFASMNLNTLIIELDGVDGNALASLPELASKCQVRSGLPFM